MNRPLLRPPMQVLALWCALAVGFPQLAQAQALRDPTLPPAAAGLPDSSGVARNLVDSGLKGPYSMLMVDGRPHLMVGTRLYAEGQQLGGARIERVTETEVWLREAGGLRKESNFPGVQRRSAPDSGSRVKP